MFRLKSKAKRNKERVQRYDLFYFGFFKYVLSKKAPKAEKEFVIDLGSPASSDSEVCNMHMHMTGL